VILHTQQTRHETTYVCELPDIYLQAGQLQTDLERVQRDQQDSVKKLEKLTCDYNKLQEYSNQQKVQIDQQADKIRHLESDLKKIGDSAVSITKISGKANHTILGI
jgi:chromosome segregation ATPase